MLYCLIKLCCPDSSTYLCLHSLTYICMYIHTCVMGVMVMGNITPTAGIKPTFLVLSASVLTIITPCRLSDVTTLHTPTCPCSSFPQRSAQTTTTHTHTYIYTHKILNRTYIYIPMVYNSESDCKLSEISACLFCLLLLYILATSMYVCVGTNS